MTLLFVYNADSGLTNGLLDTGRRIFRPNAYPCALCMITYGPFGMKEDWKKFINNLPYDVKFLHKSELPPNIKKANLDFPCLIELHNNKNKILINSKSFREIKDLESLESEVSKVLAHQSKTFKKVSNN